MHTIDAYFLAKVICAKSGVQWKFIRYEGKIADLDFVLSVELVIVQSIFGDGSARLVHIFDESDILLRWDKTNFVQVGVSRCDGQQLHLENKSMNEERTERTRP